MKKLPILILALAGVASFLLFRGDGSEPGDAPTQTADGSPDAAGPAPTPAGSPATPTPDEAVAVPEEPDAPIAGLPDFEDLPEAMRPTAFRPFADQLEAWVEAERGADSGIRFGEALCGEPPCLLDVTMPSLPEGEESFFWPILQRGAEMAGGAEPIVAQVPTDGVERYLVAFVPAEGADLTGVLQANAERLSGQIAP